jgi:hypothetical protein
MAYETLDGCPAMFQGLHRENELGAEHDRTQGYEQEQIEIEDERVKRARLRAGIKHDQVEQEKHCYAHEAQ